LHGTDWPNLAVDELTFDRFTFKRIFVTGFGHHERIKRVAEFRILLAISSEAGQVGFQAAFILASPSEAELDGVVQELIDGAPFDLTEVL